ncbi:MAG: acyltransferase [Chitinophagaceae bacterium]
MDTKDRIFGFDILRCMAIVFVLLSHSLFLLPFTAITKEYLHVYTGFIGVEIFFILSGYLVGKIFLQTLQKHSFSFATVKQFWIRRWFRTLPVYYLGLVLYAILYYLANHRFYFSTPESFLYLVFLQNFVSPHPDFFVQAWTLSVEEWFYLLLPGWAFVGCWFFKKQNKAMLSAIIGVIILITLLRLVKVYNYDPDWSFGVRMLVPLRLDSLMTGVLAAYLHLHYEKRWQQYASQIFIAGILILICCSGWFLLDITPNPVKAGFFSKILLFNFFSIGIACLMPYMSGIRKAGNLFIGKIVTHTSLISYSLYILHTLCIFVFITLYNKLFSQDILLVKFIGSWISFFIAATIMYRYYEKPFTNLRERRRKNN